MKSLQNAGEGIESFHRENTKALMNFDADSPLGETVLSLNGIRLLNIVSHDFRQWHPDYQLPKNVELIEPWLDECVVTPQDMRGLSRYLRGEMMLGHLPRVTLPKLISMLALPNTEWSQQSHHLRSSTGDFLGIYLPWSWNVALVRLFRVINSAYREDPSLFITAVEYNTAMAANQKMPSEWVSVLKKGIKLSTREGCVALLRNAEQEREMLGVLLQRRSLRELFYHPELKQLLQTDKNLFAPDTESPEAWAEDILTKLGKLPPPVIAVESHEPAEVIHPAVPVEPIAVSPRVAGRRKRPQDDGLVQESLSWDDVMPVGAGPIWTVLNPNPLEVNQAVLGVPVRGVGMQPGHAGASQGETGAETTPRHYEGVQADEIPFTAPKMVGVEVKRFEFFQHFAAAARGTVCGESGWHFCFTPLSLEDNPSWCFRVVAVNRVVRLFASPVDQQVWYDMRVRKHDKPQPLCYLVPADWLTAIEQVWTLGQVVGLLGKHLPVDTL